MPDDERNERKEKGESTRTPSTNRSKTHLILIDSIRLPFFVEAFVQPLHLDQLPDVDVFQGYRRLLDEELGVRRLSSAWGASDGDDGGTLNHISRVNGLET